MSNRDNAYVGGLGAGAGGAIAAPKQQNDILQKAADHGFRIGRQPEPKPQPKPEPVRRADGKRY